MSLPVLITFNNVSHLVDITPTMSGRHLKNVVAAEIEVISDYIDLVFEGESINGKRNIFNLGISEGSEIEAVPNEIVCAMQELGLSKKPTLESLKQYISTSRGDQTHLYIRTGIDVNAKDFDGLSPLHYAARFSNEEATRQLLRFPNIVIDEPCSKGNTPLKVSIERQHVNMIDVLVSKGADINRKEENPLTHAVITRAGRSLKTLLQYANIDVNVIVNGVTPLQIACQSQYREGIVLLLNHINIDSVSGGDNRPLAITRRAGFHSLAKLIKDQQNGLRIS